MEISCKTNINKGVRKDKKSGSTKAYCILIISFLVHFATIVEAQTYSKKYDLNFQDVNDCSWDWLLKSSHSKFSSENSESGKPVLKASYNKWGPDKKMQFVLSKTIILPEYHKNTKCEVSVISKSEASDDLLFMVKSLGQEQQGIFSESVKINSKIWKENNTSFVLTKEKAIRVVFYYAGDSLPDQTIWLDRVKIKMGGIDIGEQDYFSQHRIEKTKLLTGLNKEYLKPLTTSNDSTLLEGIADLRGKKIIGIAESTHGSKTIKTANYQFIKNLIINHKCRLVLIEWPIDKTMVWDLYIQGKVSDDYGMQIIDDMKGAFNDYEQTLAFLKWLRIYNQRSKSKVHLMGIDNYYNPKLYLFEYHLALLGKQNGKYYLKKIEEGKNTDIFKHAQSDTLLKNLLSEKEFKFYLSYVESYNGAGQGLQDSRDLNMFKRAEKLMEIYLEEDEIVAIHSHSLHLSAMDFDDLPNRYIPLGFYLRKKYAAQYFAISFQIGKGAITQDLCSGFGKNITDTLKAPPAHSFEYAGLNTSYDYFYYPSKHLGDALFSYGNILRGSRNKDFYTFSSLKKSFDAYVFVRESKPLEKVEAFPAFYAGSLIRRRTQNMNNILKELKD